MFTLHNPLRFVGLLMVTFILNFVTAENEDHVIRVETMYSIFPKNPDRPATLGEAGGLRPCGGPGKAVAMRYFYCDGGHPCKIPGDGEKRPAEFEFIPSQDINALGIRGNVIWEGGMQTVVNRPLVSTNSTVLAGHSYICTGGGAAKKELIGKTFTYQWILYRVQDEQVEVCGEADFQVVDP